MPGSKQILLCLILTICATGIYLLAQKAIRTKKPYYTILASLMAIIGYMFLFELIILLFGKLTDNFFVVLSSYLFYPAILALGPCIYLYVKSFSLSLQDNITLKNNIKHFILPIFLLIINLFSFFALRNLEEGSQNFILLTNVVTYLNFSIFFLVFLLQNIFYIYISWVTFSRHKSDYQLDRDETAKTLRWIWIFMISYIIILGLTYLFQTNLMKSGKFVLRIILTAYLVFVIYFGQKNYEELNNKEDQRNKDDNYIDQATKSKITDQLKKAVEGDKIFLDPEMNLQILASKINTNTKYLSRYINQVHNKSFTNYINELRVDEAKKLMLTEDTRNYTLETIASMCGFNSKSAFNTAFKKVVNQTPSEFREQSMAAS